MAGPLRNAPAGERPVGERGEILERHLAGTNAVPEVLPVAFDDLLAVAVPAADRKPVVPAGGAVDAVDPLLEERGRGDVAGQVPQVEDRCTPGVDVEQGVRAVAGAGSSDGCRGGARRAALAGAGARTRLVSCHVSNVG